MTKILLPLRSNAAWFGGAETRARLERIFKLYLLFYDRLVVEDGRYDCFSGAGGAFDWHSSGSQVDRRQIDYYTIGSTFGVAIGDRPIIQTKAEAAYTIDFYPILHAAGLLEADYIEYAVPELNSQQKAFVDEKTRDDLNNADLCSLLPGTHFQHQQILKSLYHDSLVAAAWRVPFSVDSRIKPIIEFKMQQAIGDWGPAVAPFFHDSWIKIGLPDYSQLPWEEIRRIRESDAGSDFRRMIERVTVAAQESFWRGADKQELDNIIDTEFSRELIKELLTRRPSALSTTLDLALNLIPFGSLVSAVATVDALSRDKVSWVSLLEEPTSATRTA